MGTPGPDHPVEPIQDLPLQKPYPAEFHQIFDFFVTHYFDKVTLVFRPPMKPDYKKEYIQEAVTNELLTTIALAHSKVHLMLQTDDRSADAVSTVIYSRLVQIVRRKLDNVQHLEIDDLILGVVALANFDLLLERPETLLTHQRAIQHLVSARGGVHNLGRSLPYVLQTDRRLAVLTGTRPLLETWTTRLLETPQRPPGKYGAAFYISQPSQELQPDVLLFCQDECRLLELFEQSKKCYDTDKLSHGDRTVIPYFFFCRDQLSAEFTNLHAKYRADQARNRCALLATKIVEFPILYGGLMPLLTEFLASELTKYLEETLQGGHPPGWQGNDDMLTWLLWVLNTAAVGWDGKDWAGPVLQDRLRRTYANHGPKVGAWKGNGKGKGKEKEKEKKVVWRKNWKEMEWEKNKTWTWSEEHLRIRLMLIVSVRRVRTYEH